MDYVINLSTNKEIFFMLPEMALKELQILIIMILKRKETLVMDFILEAKKDRRLH